MRTLIKSIGLTAVIATIFTACGGGGGSGDASFSDKADAPKITKTSLTVGNAIVVNPGDKVSALNEETEISIKHNLGKQTKSVTLLKGEANLIYGDYSLSKG